MKTSQKIAAVLVVECAVLIAAYLIGSFVEWDMDAGNWSQNARLLVAYFGVIGATVAFAATGIALGL